MSSSDRAQDGRHPVGGSNPDRHQRRAHLDKDRQALKAVQTKMKAIMAKDGLSDEEKALLGKCAKSGFTTTLVMDSVLGAGLYFALGAVGKRVPVLLRQRTTISFLGALMAHDYFQRRNGDICTQVFLASNLPNAVALREEYRKVAPDSETLKFMERMANRSNDSVPFVGKRNTLSPTTNDSGSSSAQGQKGVSRPAYPSSNVDGHSATAAVPSAAFSDPDRSSVDSISSPADDAVDGFQFGGGSADTDDGSFNPDEYFRASETSATSQDASPFSESDAGYDDDVNDYRSDAGYTQREPSHRTYESDRDSETFRQDGGRFTDEEDDDLGDAYVGRVPSYERRYDERRRRRTRRSRHRERDSGASASSSQFDGSSHHISRGRRNERVMVDPYDTGRR